METGETTYFQVGDTVVSRFDAPQPVGGVAEFRLVKNKLEREGNRWVYCIPRGGVVHPTGQCHGWPSMVLATKFVKPNNQRLLILGSKLWWWWCGHLPLSVLSSYKALRIWWPLQTATDLVKELGCDLCVIDLSNPKFVGDCRISQGQV